jgi:hypothetical protein
VKAKLRKLSSGPWEIRLPAILYALRTTPNSVQDKTPAELLNNRRFRTRFDKLNPLSFRDTDRDETIEENSNTKIREFEVGQSVYVKNYGNGPRWLKGTVEKRVGTCRYLVKWNEKLLMRHINQMLTCGGKEQQTVRETTTVAGDDDDDYEEDDCGVSIPSPHRWTDIVGVSGPQDIVIQQNSQEVATTSSHKRARTGTPPESPDSKRIALADSDSEVDLSECSDTKTESE